MTVVADQFGSPSYATDLAGAITTIISSIESGSVDQPGIYHYTITWYDFAMFIKDHYGFDCMIRRSSKRHFGTDIPHWSHSLKECLKKLEI